MPKPTKKSLDEAIRKTEDELRKLRKQRNKLDEGKIWCIYGGAVRRLQSLPPPDNHDMQPRFASKWAALKTLFVYMKRDLSEARRESDWAQGRVMKTMRVVARIENQLGKENARRAK